MLTDPPLEHPVTVLITGATGGLGGALARCYAQTGRTLILHGRDPARLGAVARACETSGARVVCAACRHQLAGSLFRPAGDADLLCQQGGASLLPALQR